MSFKMDKDSEDDSENEYKGDLIVKLHGGIPPDRIANLETLQVIEDLLKCPICLNIVKEPWETTCCGNLFCQK